MGTAAMTPVRLRIREIREARGWSQSELSRRSGVSQPTISRWEAGEQEGITFAQLEALADALEVNAALLIHHEPAKRGGRA
jgi:transcriptional regulator with XRE-family HTH domain